MLVTKRQLKVLDFDIENRPLSYWIPEQPTSEITAIATCWMDQLSSMKVSLLGRETPEEILKAFVERYNEADIVVGHYIRKHDLPTINGALLELGMPQLQPKLTLDTRLDMRSKMGVPATQEYLAEILGVALPKVHMTQNDWREANRLTPRGLKKTEKRVSGDVMQNMLLRNRMLELNLLKGPKIWRP